MVSFDYKNTHIPAQGEKVMLSKSPQVCRMGNNSESWLFDVLTELVDVPLLLETFLFLHE